MDVGSIVGYLRLDGTQFREEIAQAITELRVLSGTNVNIDVKTDKLREVETDAGAAVRGLENVDKEVSKVGANGQRSTGMLLTALLTLGPALIPIGAGAVGLGLAFGGMAAAGIAAFMGIKDEMARGTTTGLAYSTGLHQVQTALMGIADLAARNILGNFQTSVADLMAKVPTLSSDVGTLAAMAGNAGSAIISGLLAAFVQLAPYMQVAATYVVQLAQQFQRFAAGDGFTKFASYAVSVLPTLINVMGQLVTLVSHLVEALLPFGAGILTALEVFIGALNDIPMGMLTLLAQLALAVFAGFKTWEAITGIVEGVTETLKALNVTLEISEGVLRNLDMAASIIGVAMAAFTLILAHNAQVTEEAKAKQEAYADALRASKGAIDEEVRAVAAKALEEEGALQIADQLGLSLSDVTSATLGQKDALQRVLPVLNGYIVGNNQAVVAGQAGIAIQGSLSQKAETLRNAITGQSDALQAQIRTQKAVNAASEVTRANMTDEEQKTIQLASAYHMSVSAYQSATAAQKSDAASLAATTAKMILESDAAGLLKNALDRLNGKAITAAEAQQQFDQSLVSMTKAQNSAGKAVHITSANINSQTDAAVQVRGSLIQQVNALERVVEANGGLSNSTGKARSQMMSMRQEIINNAVAHGVDRAAVTKYIDTILKIPKSVPPTKLQVDNAAAVSAIQSFKAELATVAGKVVTTYVRTITSTIANGPYGGVGGVSGHGMLTHNFRGGIQSFQTGGFRQTAFQSFADGKLPSQAMIAPDGANLVQWAETGTGDEAFIPLGQGNHARSVAIWEEAGRRLGVSAAAQSLTGIEISGTLQTPWGPSQIRGVVQSEMKAAQAKGAVADRLRNGVSRS